MNNMEKINWISVLYGIGFVALFFVIVSISHCNGALNKRGNYIHDIKLCGTEKLECYKKVLGIK